MAAQRALPLSTSHLLFGSRLWEPIDSFANDQVLAVRRVLRTDLSPSGRPAKPAFPPRGTCANEGTTSDCHMQRKCLIARIRVHAFSTVFPWNSSPRLHSMSKTVASNAWSDVARSPHRSE